MDYIQQAIRTESLDLFKVDRTRLLHAALGITTELSELLLGAWANDDLNAKEEVGDVFWYLAIAADDLGVTFGDLKSIANLTPDQIEEEPGEALAKIYAELNDVVKRACFYGVEFDEARFGIWLGNLIYFLEGACRWHKVTPEECMEANIAKLSRRYPDKFTTEAAVTRDIDAEVEAVAGA